MSRIILLLLLGSRLDHEVVLGMRFDDVSDPARILFSRIIDPPLAGEKPLMASHTNAAGLTIMEVIHERHGKQSVLVVMAASFLLQALRFGVIRLFLLEFQFLAEFAALLGFVHVWLIRS